MNVSLALCQRNAGLTLAFSVRGTYCSCSVFCLLKSSAMTLSRFNILVESQGLLRTSGNLELQSFKRRVTGRLIFTIVLIVHQNTSLIGLSRDVDMSHMDFTRRFKNLIGSDATCFVNKCVGHFWRSLLRDLSVGP